MATENTRPVSDDLLTTALSLTASMADQQETRGLLRQGLSLCIKVLGCERGMIIAMREGGLHQTIERAGEGCDRPYSNTALRLAGSKNEPLLISDTVEDAALGIQESIQSQDIRSVLCGKLDIAQTLSENRSAYLYCDSHTNRHPLTPQDLERFRLLSRLMARLVATAEALADKEAQIEHLKGQVRERQYEDLVFGSSSFEKCLSLVKQSAVADVPVLLMGETGTGKESLAKVVHKLSKRKSGPFLAVNCGAIPATLIESELFGHEKGAFTGAVGAKKGYFEEASGGTLFLDEIGELPLAAQTHFLRVLQEGEVLRVGATRPIKVDVRIVSATNIDLDKAVAENRFRKDLLYRLNVVTVSVPPIRERDDDALLLTRFFLSYYAQSFGHAPLHLSRDAEKAILIHDWPGNVREIQNRVQRAVITSQDSTVGTVELNLLEKKDSPGYASLHEARESVDREMISFALKKSPGNLTNAAKLLDIDRKSLRLLLEKYGIESRE